MTTRIPILFAFLFSFLNACASAPAPDPLPGSKQANSPKARAWKLTTVRTRTGQPWRESLYVGKNNEIEKLEFQAVIEATEATEGSETWKVKIEESNDVRGRGPAPFDIANEIIIKRTPKQVQLTINEKPGTQEQLEWLSAVLELKWPSYNDSLLGIDVARSLWEEWEPDPGWAQSLTPYSVKSARIRFRRLKKASSGEIAEVVLTVRSKNRDKRNVIRWEMYLPLDPIMLGLLNVTTNTNSNPKMRTTIRRDRVQLEETDETDLLGRGEINNGVFAGRSAIKFCFERRLQKNPTLRGRIDVKFVILPNGTVHPLPTITKSSLGDADVEECILSIVKTLKFRKPKRDSSITVNYPFVFTGLK